MIAMHENHRDTRFPLPGDNPSTGLYWWDDGRFDQPTASSGSTARTRNHDLPHQPLLHSRGRKQGALRGYCEEIRPYCRSVLRGGRRSPRADGPGHPALDPSTFTGWGTAYRYGIKRRTPRRSEGSWCQWSRSERRQTNQSELVLKSSGLPARSLVYVTREATRGLVTPTCAVEEVTSS